VLGHTFGDPRVDQALCTFCFFARGPFDRRHEKAEAEAPPDVSISDHTHTNQPPRGTGFWSRRSVVDLGVERAKGAISS
jgi:hypothetical protein